MTPAALNSDGIASLLLAADELAAVVADVRYGGLAAPLLARGVHPVALIVVGCALAAAILFAPSFALPVPVAGSAPAAVVAGVFDLPLIVAEGVLVFPAAFAPLVPAAEPVLAAVVAGVFGFPLIFVEGVLAPAIVFAAAFALPGLAAEPAAAVAGVFGLVLIVAGCALAAVAVCVVVFALPAVVAGHWPVCSFLPMT